MYPLVNVLYAMNNFKLITATNFFNGYAFVNGFTCTQKSRNQFHGFSFGFVSKHIKIVLLFHLGKNESLVNLRCYSCITTHWVNDSITNSFSLVIKTALLLITIEKGMTVFLIVLKNHFLG